LSIKEAIAFSHHHDLSMIEPSDVECDVFAEIRRRIESAIAMLIVNKSGVDDNNTHKVFVKLSTRSPKDVIYEEKNEKVDLFLLDELERVSACRLKSELVNEVGGGSSRSRSIDKDEEEKRRLTMLESVAVESWLSACSMAFECNGIDEVLKLLLKSTRVNFDLNRALDHAGVIDDADDDNGGGGGGGDTSLHGKLLPLSLIVREWLPRPVWSEFRCFVYKGQLTAISQYYHKCYFDEVANHQPRIKECIKAFFNKIKDELSLCCGDCYIMDVSIILVVSTLLSHSVTTAQSVLLAAARRRGMNLIQTRSKNCIASIIQSSC
jgi:hypothetical protein